MKQYDYIKKAKLLDKDKLIAEINNLKLELSKKKLSLLANKHENISDIKKLRKKIAQLYTIVNQKVIA